MIPHDASNSLFNITKKQHSGSPIDEPLLLCWKTCCKCQGVVARTSLK